VLKNKIERLRKKGGEGQKDVLGDLDTNIQKKASNKKRGEGKRLSR